MELKRSVSYPKPGRPNLPPKKGFDQKYFQLNFFYKFCITSWSGCWSGLDPYSATGWIRIRIQWIRIRNTAFTPLPVRPAGSMRRIRIVPSFQYCGSGTVCFWASWIRIRIITHRGMEPEPSNIRQKWKKTLDSYCFVTFLGFLSLKNDENVPTKSNKQKYFFF